MKKLTELVLRTSKVLCGAGLILGGTGILIGGAYMSREETDKGSVAIGIGFGTAFCYSTGYSLIKEGITGKEDVEETYGYDG